MCMYMHFSAYTHIYTHIRIYMHKRILAHTCTYKLTPYAYTNARNIFRTFKKYLVQEVGLNKNVQFFFYFFLIILFFAEFRF